MKSSSAATSSRLSVAHNEAAAPDEDDTPIQLPTVNLNPSKSPRSVRFAPTAADDERGSHYSNAISPSGSFIGSHHDGGDLLACVASPPQRMEELPPFSLTREDVEAAFEFLDVNGSGLLTMSNLKQRLSAFYPQLTSKEYKFLVEDPSGNNGVSGGGGSGGGNAHSGPAEPSTAAPASTLTAAGEGGKADGGNAAASAGKSANSEPTGASAATGGGGGGDLPPSPDGPLSGGSSRVYGSRAGLDVDQLWDVIHSFQQLQQNIGAGAAAEPTHRPIASGGARRHGSPGHLVPSADAGVAASLLHSAGEGGFDAVGEAFRVYDPRNTHYVEREVLSRIMAQIGFGELNEEDLTLLVGTADFDGDGRISLDDFRRLVNMKGRFKKA